MMLTHVTGPNSNGKKTYTFASQYTLEVPQRYEVQSVVGKGAYGIVCSAVDTLSGEKVAIKKVSKVFDDLVDGKRILREVKLLGFFRHHNILSLKDVFRPSDPETFVDIYIVTELMDTDMHTVLRSRSLELSEEHCQFFIFQLLCALHYIHSAGVLHRDLKPANLLINSQCELLLCDFGLARGKGAKMTDYVITRWYRPPELLLICDQYDASVDMWGVGCLAAEFVTRKTLFPGRDYIHQINLITDALGVPTMGELRAVRSTEALAYVKSIPSKPPQTLRSLLPENVNPDLLDFLEKLLTYDPTKRMTAREALQHAWLQGYTDESAFVDAPQIFSWEYDSSEIDEQHLRKAFWDEAIKFSSSTK